ncbi:MAG: limonene-1,2-epoxide hydrolase [Polyangiales bacterium]|jgi:limonene-1,2-epoxide hydrolase
MSITTLHSSAERTPTETVEAFLAALVAMDTAAARALMADHIVYQNVPFPADRGVAATTKTLEKFLVPFRTFEVETLNIAANGNTVLTERIDTFSNGKFRAGFWVCGTFEVEDGKITLWRDRFDLADMTFNLVRGLLRAPFR